MTRPGARWSDVVATPYVHSPRSSLRGDPSDAIEDRILGGSSCSGDSCRWDLLGHGYRRLFLVSQHPGQNPVYRLDRDLAAIGPHDLEGDAEPDQDLGNGARIEVGKICVFTPDNRGQHRGDRGDDAVEMCFEERAYEARVDFENPSELWPTSEAENGLRHHGDSVVGVWPCGHGRVQTGRERVLQMTPELRQHVFFGCEVAVQGAA